MMKSACNAGAFSVKGSGRLSHDTHEQRRTVCSGEYKEEGTIQYKIYFFGRRGGHASTDITVNAAAVQPSSSMVTRAACLAWDR